MSSLTSSMWFARPNRRRVRAYLSPPIQWRRRDDDEHESDHDEQRRRDVQIDDPTR